MHSDNPLTDYLDLLWEISPQADGFAPGSPAQYDLVANGFWSPWPQAAYACEAWRLLPFTLPQGAEFPPLIFEHLHLPPVNQSLVTALNTEGLASSEGRAAVAIDTAVMQMSQAQAMASHMLRERIPLYLSSAARRFLSNYPDVPKANAGLLRAGYLGGALPLRLFASVIWVDTLKGSAAPQPRLFRQPINGAGVALGVCQSFPIDSVTAKRWIGN